MAARVPRIAITMGEPAGIGPDLLAAIANRPMSAELVVIGDESLLQARAAALGMELALFQYHKDKPSPGAGLRILNISTDVSCTAGELDQRNSTYVLKTLDRAVAGCMTGEFDAMVTAPVHKGIINDAGISFTGHTEYLAHLVDVDKPVMMLTTPGLRVALATTHLPLSEVADSISRDLLRCTIRVLHRDLSKWFGIPDPSIFVCGLNPHAGEQGHLGQEELTTINPVLEELRLEKLRLIGPLSADTAFIPANLKKADVFLAMYHDQGLPVLKYAGFGRAANITLGLPFIRTSVDHGTALELAGSGNVESNSLIYAIDNAIEMSVNSL